VTDAPPPPPAEPIQPILTPAGTRPASGSGDGLPPYGSVPQGAATRSPGLLLGVAIAAVVGLIANGIGLAGFPGNAPVEMLYALGIGVDLIAIAVTCGIGAYLARRGYPLRSKSAFAIVSVVLAGVALLAWIWFGGIGSILELIPPDRGRYMYASGGLFIAGAPWVLAVIFGAHAYRRRGTTSNNVLALVGFAVPALLAVYAIVSSVIYGMGLTD